MTTTTTTTIAVIPIRLHWQLQAVKSWAVVFCILFSAFSLFRQSWVLTADAAANNGVNSNCSVCWQLCRCPKIHCSEEGKGERNESWGRIELAAIDSSSSSLLFVCASIQLSAATTAVPLFFLSLALALSSRYGRILFLSSSSLLLCLLIDVAMCCQWPILGGGGEWMPPPLLLLLNCLSFSSSSSYLIYLFA